jgi:hypothetical protein
MSVPLDPEHYPDPLPLEAIVWHDDGPPIFFGHYWLKGTPMLLGPRHACLDWSVAKGGRLCAYRFDGEQTLDPRNLIHVAANGLV